MINTSIQTYEKQALYTWTGRRRTYFSSFDSFFFDLTLATVSKTAWQMETRSFQLKRPVKDNIGSTLLNTFVIPTAW